MHHLLVDVAVVLVLFSAWASLRFLRAISYAGTVPRVGPPGALGYIKTAFRFVVDAESVIVQGRKEFSGRPFVVPTPHGPVFLLGPEYSERVRNAPDSVLNEMMVVNEDLQLPYTMDAHQLSNPYQAKVLRTSVNRAIPSYIPELLEESTLALDSTLQYPDTEKFKSIPVFDTMTHLVARISNRVIFGEELCRDEEFLHAVVRFAETTPAMAPFIQWSPRFMQPVVYHILSYFLGSKKEVLRILVPHLKKYMATRDSSSEKIGYVSELLIQSAPPEEPIEGIAIRLLNINFGSIHTSSIFITQALFELALLPLESIRAMREEIELALETEGGWTKAAIDKFYLVDSTLREVGRYYGLMHFALGRHVMTGFDLGNGQSIPPGHRVAIDMKAVHFNPDVYPDPQKCDLHRFAKLRSGLSEGLDSANGKYAFSTVDTWYLPFGAGRHACAGRHFASTELKIMLAHLLLTYDISYPPGITHRPKNMLFNGAIIPDTKACLTFRRREDIVDQKP